jgi:hypothetical protein
MIPSIIQTSDYNQFKFFPGNRDTLPSKINDLKKIFF